MCTPMTEEKTSQTIGGRLDRMTTLPCLVNDLALTRMTNFQLYATLWRNVSDIHYHKFITLLLLFDAMRCLCKGCLSDSVFWSRYLIGCHYRIANINASHMLTLSQLKHRPSSWASKQTIKPRRWRTMWQTLFHVMAMRINNLKPRQCMPTDEQYLSIQHTPIPPSLSDLQSRRIPNAWKATLL